MNMTREQAIFFEVMEDLNLEGAIEALFFAYHEFIVETDTENATDLEVHRKAKECLLRCKYLLNSDICFYDLRWDILKNLALDDAVWEYADIESKLQF
ncbi:hypothetical protein O0550_12095 [Brevibacillus halotolerans]|uniref:hypothetical protein n=1 Tax=Brevibacillus TaxID=55080 RepID=UPI00215BEDDD|nr:MULTISPECIES: hypothetical protein [Brevibacillus]MCR8963935.1 hypothetical protein [Brevibacillus laterosporus]MCZ0836090.1 hypothetical protein [Brevibacillus halotolerans]